MFVIDKTFEFCYGHRVWTQQLDGRYADDLKCACRHLHGHEAKVQVFLQADKLKDGMVTDFRHLEWLKRWLNEYVDHKFLIDLNDPLKDVLFPKTVKLNDHHMFTVGETDIMVTSRPASGSEEFLVVGHQYNYPNEPSPQKELYDGLLIVPFVPTSENLAAWLFRIVKFVMAPLGVTVAQVDWWETPKSRSSYRNPELQQNKF